MLASPRVPGDPVSDAERVRRVVVTLLRVVAGVGACALVLLSALVLGVGSMEYPLFSRPGLRFVVLEAVPPLAAAVAVLAAWALPREARTARRALAAILVLALLARALGRIGFGAPPAAWLEVTFCAVVVGAVAMLEIVRALPVGRGER